jgi:hypothetical protein
MAAFTPSGNEKKDVVIGKPSDYAAAVGANERRRVEGYPNGG